MGSFRALTATAIIASMTITAIITAALRMVDHEYYAHIFYQDTLSRYAKGSAFGGGEESIELLFGPAVALQGPSDDVSASIAHIDGGALPCAMHNSDRRGTATVAEEADKSGPLNNFFNLMSHCRARIIYSPKKWRILVFEWQSINEDLVASTQ